VANRKGGSGKSTVCRARASAAGARGENVTLFDTDSSRSCFKWQEARRARGTWSPRVEVIHSLEVGRIADTIAEIYDQPDQEHLILTDTFGGASETHDELATLAHLVLTPMLRHGPIARRPGRRRSGMSRCAGGCRPPTRLHRSACCSTVCRSASPKTEREIVARVYGTLPAFESFLSNRAACIRMDKEGLLGPIRDAMVNRALARHVQTTLDEAEAVLAEIDSAIRRDARAAGPWSRASPSPLS